MLFRSGEFVVAAMAEWGVRIATKMARAPRRKKDVAIAVRVFGVKTVSDSWVCGVQKGKVPMVSFAKRLSC